MMLYHSDKYIYTYDNADDVYLDGNSYDDPEC